MSETSIPSTNADPLNSNSPTPPISSHRPPIKNVQSIPNNNNKLKPKDTNNNNNINKHKPKATSQQDMYNKTPNNQFIQRSLDDNNSEGKLLLLSILCALPFPLSLSVPS